jgi:type VI secretion system protein ImpL
VLAFVLREVLTRLKARASNAKLLDGLLGKGTPEPAESAEVATLRQRFGEAVAILRHSRSASTGGGLARLAALGSARYLYQLPWYVFIGAPGSGKTTALINSGLRFPSPRSSAPTRSRASAAPATATGGLPTKPC